VAAILHHRDREVDRVAHVFQAGDAAGPQRCALHDACVQLDLSVGVEASTNTRIEKRFVFHMANRGDRSGQGAVTDASPTEFERPLDGGLAQWAFGGRNWSRAAVDDERRSSQGFFSGRRKDPTVQAAAFLFPPVGYELHTPAGVGAIDRPPFAEPPVGVHPS
jgi:hypothetical protein